MLLDLHFEKSNILCNFGKGIPLIISNFVAKL